MRKHVLSALALGLSVAAGGAAWAQTPAPTRLRGTIDAVNGDTLTVTPRNGSPATVLLAPNARIAGITVAKITDIKPGSFIGTAGIPQPDGSQKALEVHVFPPSMNGTGEGFRPWDRPNSTMTNGTVGDLVVSNGRTMTVKYSTGEKKIVVPEDVPIVSIEPGNRSMLTPGAHVVLFVTKAADGTMTAVNVSVGENGLTPPM